MPIKGIIFFLCSIFLTSCVTIGDINAASGRIERLWLLESQKNEDLFRYRVIEAPFLITFKQVGKTCQELGYPIVERDFEEGRIIVQSTAPAPLSKEEWKKVAEFENPRVKEHGGWYMYLPDNPEDYVITALIKLKRIGNQTLVFLTYELSNPKFESRGIRLTRVAPPMASELGAMKFWLKLEEKLKQIGVKPPRKRKGKEFDI